MTEQTYYLRFSTAADEQALLDFHHANPSPYISVRKEEALRDTLSNGLTIFLEKEDGTIVGASSIYPHRYPNDKARIQFNELGTTRLTVEGYRGLFNIMVGTKVMKAQIYNTPAEGFVFNTFSKGFQSKVEKDGYVRIEDPAKLAACKAALDNTTVTPSDKPLVWYSFSVANAPRLVRENVLPALDNPISNGKASLRVDFSRIAQAKAFEDGLRDIAAIADNDPQAAQKVAQRCMAVVSR